MVTRNQTTPFQINVDVAATLIGFRILLQREKWGSRQKAIRGSYLVKGTQGLIHKSLFCNGETCNLKTQKRKGERSSPAPWNTQMGWAIRKRLMLGFQSAHRSECWFSKWDPLRCPEQISLGAQLRLQYSFLLKAVCLGFSHFIPRKPSMCKENEHWRSCKQRKASCSGLL